MRGRLTHRNQSDERGAAMLAALCLAVVFAICLSSYLALCYASLKMSTRSQMSMRSLEIAEMGLEQGLYALNTNNGFLTGGWVPQGGEQVTTMAVTSSGLVPIPIASDQTLLNFGSGMTGQVAISVSPYPINGTPTITSTATVTLASDGSTVVRKITTTAATAPAFVNAVAATTGQVQFVASGTLDSYDSRLPTGSPATYAAQNTLSLPGFLGASAVVLSQDTSLAATVILNNAILYGYAVGNQANSISYASSAYVGGYPTSTTSIDPTRLITNPPPVAAPPSPTPYPYALPYQPAFLDISLSEGTPQNIGILNAPTTLGSSTSSMPKVYEASSINLTSGIVTIQGPVVIVVDGNVNISSGGQIQLATAGVAPASLTIFLEGGSMTLGDNGIVNSDVLPLPKRVAIVGTRNTSNTNSIQISTSSTNPFYGVIYFPYLPITVTGNPVIYGSIVGQSVTFTGSPTIHYDMALRYPDAITSDAAFTSLYSPIAAGNLLETVGP
jgi:hypothetical protein